MSPRIAPTPCAALSSQRVGRGVHGGDSGHPVAALPPEPPTDPDSGRALGDDRPAPRGELLVRTGPVAGLRFALRDGVITVGRSSQSDCPLHDQAVSRRHFELEVTAEGTRLRDLGSGNGTRLNGARVAEAPLQHGDRIAAGDSIIEFREATPANAAGRNAAPASSRSARPRRDWRLSLAVGLPVVAVASLVSTIALHRRQAQQRIAQQAFDRGWAELAGDPPDPDLALADFLAAQPDDPDRRAVRDSIAAAQDLARAIEQLGRARELAAERDFEAARRQLLGLPASAYFDRMSQVILGEIAQKEAALLAAPRPPVPVIRTLAASPSAKIPRPRSVAPAPVPAKGPAHSRFGAPASVPANAPASDDRAEQLCDDADALVGPNPEAARQKYRAALRVARPGSAAARRAQGGWRTSAALRGALGRRTGRRWKCKCAGPKGCACTDAAQRVVLQFQVADSGYALKRSSAPVASEPHRFATSIPTR